jgi:transposase InsO family protein
LINPRISGILLKANQEKKKREENKEIVNNVKFRPPLFLRDYKPGAKVEKDMKLIPRLGIPHNSKKGFWYQQTIIDSFTKIRSLELTKNYESKTIADVLEPMLKRLGFSIATFNGDGGSENQGEVNKKLKELGIIHFQSRPGTPTDNPRVERSHKTDDDEFYNQGNMYRSFEKQKEALKK